MKKNEAVTKMRQNNAERKRNWNVKERKEVRRTRSDAGSKIEDEAKKNRKWVIVGNSEEKERCGARRDKTGRCRERTMLHGGRTVGDAVDAIRETGDGVLSKGDVRDEGRRTGGELRQGLDWGRSSFSSTLNRLLAMKKRRGKKK